VLWYLGFLQFGSDKEVLLPKVFTLLRSLQHDLPSGWRWSTSRDHNLRVHGIRVQGVDSGFPPSGLDILFGVCMSMSSTVELPESSLDDCGASFSDVIVCSLTVILLQRCKETNVKRLKQVRSMGRETEK